jgi:predicted tellurium resistance membrane protein TerC
MDWLTDPQAWVALVTLTALEIVLGVDNIIFISILVGKLPRDRQQSARLIGLGLAMLMRIALLFSISWIASMSEPWFTIFAHAFSGRDFVLMGGGLFLLAKATMEIHNKLEGESHAGDARAGASFFAVLTQIILLDIVFSIDSVITAIGMAEHIGIMVTAVVIAVGFMMVFSGAISHFVHRHPTVKMLALAFLLLIGVALLADGFHQHIPRGYIYFAMGFSVFVEMLNLRVRASHAKPVELRQPYE